MRFGYVGLGRATKLYHVPALARIPGAISIGGADPDPRQRAAWTNDTGTPAFETLDELLERRPDVVVIASPPALHADQCIAALESGAHVYCEKPFTATVEDADRVLAAVAATGRLVAVNHHIARSRSFV
jgi:predicted dehydrogenase